MSNQENKPRRHVEFAGGRIPEFVVRIMEEKKAKRIEMEEKKAKKEERKAMKESKKIANSDSNK